MAKSSISKEEFMARALPVITREGDPPTLREIAEATDCTIQTVYYRLMKYGIRRRRARWIVERV